MSVLAVSAGSHLRVMADLQNTALSTGGGSIICLSILLLLLGRQVERGVRKNRDERGISRMEMLQWPLRFTNCAHLRRRRYTPPEITAPHRH
jgi:hypothetical protein